MALDFYKTHTEMKGESRRATDIIIDIIYIVIDIIDIIIYIILIRVFGLSYCKIV